MDSLPAIARKDIPILTANIDGHPLIYLDNAATTQKPVQVLKAMEDFYRTQNANAHRGMHVLAERATEVFEDARRAVQKFLHAPRHEEIIFTHGCTEAINLVARSFGSSLKPGDGIALSLLEHHSNIVPWMQLKQERGIDLAWIGIDDEGTIQLDSLTKILDQGKITLVAVTGQSNVTGTKPPLREIIQIAHKAGAFVLIDAAQLIAHSPIDVQELDCDFLAFSGHKMYGPMGIGVLYGKHDLLETMPPFLGGGGMIHDVRDDSFTPTDLPQKFEAGTQPVAEAAGLKAAIEWIGQHAWTDIQAHEHSLIDHAYEKLSTVDGLRIVGTKNSKNCHGCVSFVINGIHPHDLTEILGRQGICLRAGHHCTQPLHRRLGLTATSRLSVAVYNTKEEIELASQAIQTLIKEFRR